RAQPLDRPEDASSNRRFDSGDVVFDCRRQTATRKSESISDDMRVAAKRSPDFVEGITERQVFKNFLRPRVHPMNQLGHKNVPLDVVGLERNGPCDVGCCQVERAMTVQLLELCEDETF